jgi:quercetin dioxygenase-like cupin family protein
MELKVRRFDEAIRRVQKLAQDKLAKGENADEFVELGEMDGFKLYIAAGKTIQNKKPAAFHENPRDVFMLLLSGEMWLTFENGEKVIIKKGQYLVLPRYLGHHCVFRKMTVALEGVYEKGL